MALETFDQPAAELRLDAPIATENAGVNVVATTEIAAIEADWRQLEGQGIGSPGQSFDFLRQWIKSFDIPAADCLFVVAKDDMRPVAAMALHRRKKLGVRLLNSFPGDHVGVNAPLLDVAYWQQMSVDERQVLWQKIKQQFAAADLVHICGVPASDTKEADFFAGFGPSAPGGDVHRAVFDNWVDCDSTQRSKSRRKHDRQQGAKLTAMGDVSFDVLESKDDIDRVLETMFAQRNQRFKIQGISDPFDSDAVRNFYKEMFKRDSSLKGRLHVLRLNGEIVATRYNLVHGERIFCLISSMSVAPEVQPGSPGKQCLLRVMQTEFDNGYAMFDMGQGLTDEKRHWCNVHMPVRQFNVPLTFVGRVAARWLAGVQSLRVAVKDNKRLFALAKNARALLSRQK